MDINELALYILTPAAQVAMIIGLAEIFKRLGTPVKFIPLIDLLLGIIGGIAVYSSQHPMITAVMLGIAQGLAACGLFSGIKNTVEGFKSSDE